MRPSIIIPESRAVFAHSDTVCTVGDVICAAFFLGEAQPLWAELLRSVEAQTRAEEQELEADSDALQSLSEEFRYQRDLITTEETEQWLEARDLTLEDFENHLVRLYWRQKAGQPLQPGPAEIPPATLEERELLRQELLLSGAFERLAGNHVHTMARDAQGGTWVGTDQGLARYDGKKFSKIMMPKEEGVLSLHCGRDGLLWVGTRNSIWRHNGRQIEDLATAYKLPPQTVLAIHGQTNGTLWFVSVKGGAFYAVGRQRLECGHESPEQWRFRS